MRNAYLGLFGLLVITAAATSGAVAPDRISVTRSDDGRAAAQAQATITVADGATRSDIAAQFADVFGGGSTSAATFHDTYASMQWDAFNEHLPEYFRHEHDLTEREIETLLTHSAVLLELPNDVLERTYVPGEYTFPQDVTDVAVAEALIEPVRAQEDAAAYVHERIATSSATATVAYIREELELLPDLVPLPAQDIGIRYSGADKRLVFTTIYYNKGAGDLELRADPSTIGVIGDFERRVNQRIYRPDGSYRERPAGTFFWHAPHLHYHFADFVTYELTDESGNALGTSDEYLQKSTFCIRDVSRVDIGENFAHDAAAYEICGRERQGISVGWGDAYFHTYPDQNIPITELSSGTYVLTFNVNPEDRFVEESRENNVASVRFAYNAEEDTIDILETVPPELPNFEHIHVEQQL